MSSNTMQQKRKNSGCPKLVSSEGRKGIIIAFIGPLERIPPQWDTKREEKHLQTFLDPSKYY